MDPITTGQALDTAKHYLDKVVDAPFKELSGFLADKVNFWRYKNRINTILKAKKFLEDKGIDPIKALPDTVIPLIEASGDTEDETLSDMFSGLLASSLTPDTYETVHPSYAKVLSQLAPLDARILSEWYKSITADGKVYSTVAADIHEIARVFKISESVVLLSFQNLWRLGICSHGSGLDHLNQVKQIVFTDYGWALMNACVRV